MPSTRCPGRTLLATTALVALAAACAEARPTAAAPAAPAPAWQILCTGDDLGAFAATSFGGEGEVWIEDDAVQLGFGSPLTGIHWTGEALPLAGYEVEVAATRVDGDDFFCGLTFPVGDSHCTLVCGGWGGSLTGLSNIDGQDASDNATNTLVRYRQGQRYLISVRVTDERIEARIDGELVAAHARPGHRIDLRPEVLPCRPLGIASFATQAAIHSVRLRLLP